MRVTPVLIALSLLAGAARTDESGAEAPPVGSVSLPVERFEALIEAARPKPPKPDDPEPTPPVDHALESLEVTVELATDAAKISSELILRVLGREWVSVPVLADDAAVSLVTVDGERTATSRKDGQLVIHVRGQGSHRVKLRYAVPVEKLVGGQRVQVPVPRATAGQLTATLPGTGWKVVVLPASGVEQQESGDSTRVSASLLPSDRVQLAWGAAQEAEHAFTRAAYDVKVVGEGVFIDATYEIDVQSDEPVDVPLAPATYALREVTVGGKPARVVLLGSHHAVTLQGHGLRTVHVALALNVDRAQGQPAVDLAIPVVPISRFEVQLPGKRDVSVDPLVPLTVNASDSATRITAHFPSAAHVRFGWTDSRPVPEQLVRMNGQGFLALSVEQGALRAAATYAFDVINGKARELAFALPDGVVVYEVAGDGVADWRTIADEKGGGRRLVVYLDQPRHGQLEVRVSYDSLLPKSVEARANLPAPLLQPSGVHRYQGTVLLLAGETLELEPAQAEGFTSVGEEALPPEVRARLEGKVAHGRRHVGDAPPLLVNVVEPHREPARFDVAMNVLATVEEGALRGRATADVTIKSGSLKELVLRTDPSFAVLEVVAPSLLRFDDREEAGERVVTAHFTEALEGGVRVSLAFERILDPNQERLDLPPWRIDHADVQRGHVAVEASVAVEVKTLRIEGIHEATLQDLPQVLTSSTKNPILLAYQYSHLPYELAVGVTRHESITPVESRVASAQLQTELKSQGNAVTRVTWIVTNQQRQFLRVTMPAGAELWEVLVDGRSVRPATDAQGVLIVPLSRAEQSFPVTFAYATKRAPLGVFGSVKLEAPRPDLFVESAQWDVELPEGFTYQRVRSNLDVDEGVKLPRLRLTRKLMAASDDPARVSVAYAAELGARGIDLLAGVLGLGLGLLAWRAQAARPRAERALALVVAAAAIALVAALGASPWAVMAPVLAAVVALVLSAASRTARAPAA